MSVSHDIPVLVNRLKNADIPMDNLCYEINDTEWRELVKYLEEFVPNPGNVDLSYAEDIYYFGMHVRKRTTPNPEVKS